MTLPDSLKHPRDPQMSGHETWAEYLARVAREFDWEARLRDLGAFAPQRAVKAENAPLKQVEADMPQIIIPVTIQPDS